MVTTLEIGKQGIADFINAGDQPSVSKIFANFRKSQDDPNDMGARGKLICEKTCSRKSRVIVPLWPEHLSQIKIVYKNITSRTKRFCTNFHTVIGCSV